MESMKSTKTDVAVKQEESSTTAALLEMLPAKREKSFVMKLYNMLNLNDYPDIVRWNRDGTSFTIEKRPEFISVVLQIFFGGVKMSSFLRQLNMYSFTKDAHTITYSHPCFTKANPILLKLIKRTQLPASKKMEHLPIGLGSLRNVAVGTSTDLDSAFVSVKTETKTSQTSISEDTEEGTQKLPKFSSNRPIVSPHSPQARSFQLSSNDGVCRRCAQVEHLFEQEDSFEDVFDEETNVNTTPEPNTTALEAAEGCLSDENPFFATGAFSAFKADSKYFNSKDLYNEN